MYIKKRDLKRVLFAVVLQFAVLLAPLASISHAESGSDTTPNSSYSLIVIAKTGDAVGTAHLQSIGKGVSINDKGTIAFTARLDTGGQGIFVGDGSTPLRYINPGFYNFAYSDAVQINNSGTVVARDMLPGPKLGYVRRWVGTNQNETIAGPRNGFDSVDAYPSINNNIAGAVVFNARIGADNLLATPNTLSSGAYFPLILPRNALSPRPMIADDLHIVTRFGDSRDGAIRLYSYDFAASQMIAEVGGFWRAVGRSPGISDDGRVATFYGDLTLNGAQVYHTTAGPGIFASIDEGTGTRKLVRLAGWLVETQGNGDGACDPGETCNPPYAENIQAPGGNDDGICNPGEVCLEAMVAELGFDPTGNPLYFKSFDADSRVAVVHFALGEPGIHDDRIVVSFLATPNAGSGNSSSQTGISDQKGLWTVDVQEYPGWGPVQRTYGADKAVKVAQVGDVIGGRQMTDLVVYDPLASTSPNSNSPSIPNSVHRRIAFWAATNQGDMVIKAVSFRNPLIFIPGISGSKLVDVANGKNEELWLGLSGIYDPIFGYHPDWRRNLSLTGKESEGRIVIAPDVIRYVVGIGPIKALPIYGPFLEALTNQGGYREYKVKDPIGPVLARCDYENQKDNPPTLFVFPYDWRKSNVVNAKILHSWVRDCIRKFYPNEDFDIVTHSMGSLLARRYILDNPVDHHVERLITMGAPWLGSPKLMYVLETGDFIFPIAAGPAVQYAAESMTAAHQLMPSRAYFDLLGAPPLNEEDVPLIEKGWDLNGNGKTDDRYDTYDELVDVMNKRHESKPGTTSKDFHDYSTSAGAQDNWHEDSTGVQYFHLIGKQGNDTTIEQVVASSFQRCWWREEPDPPLFCRSPELRFITKKGQGDGTVAYLSARKQARDYPNDPKDYNALDAQLCDFGPKSPAIPSSDKLAEHVQLPNNPAVITKVFEFLGITPSSSNHLTCERLNLIARGLGLGSTDASASTPSYHTFFVAGGDSVYVKDDQGNSTAPILGDLLGTVPGVTTYSPADTMRELLIPATGSYTVTFQTTSQPLTIDLTASDGVTVTQAIRYQDLALPAGVTATLTLTDQGVGALRYDADRDGTFETIVTPTVSVSGPQAQDVEPPTITISTTAQLDTILVTLTAEDSGSGVKTLFYSLDGARYHPYTSTLQLAIAETPILYALADDNLANRQVAVFPLDKVSPVVHIDSPLPGSLVDLGQPLTVTLTATDNIRVAYVKVSLDVDGNGSIWDPTDTITATRTSTDTYVAAFAKVSGPLGVRTIEASALDPSKNSNTVTTTLTVTITPSSILTVNVTDDDDGTCSADHCSLRQAIQSANAAHGTRRIHFAIPGAAPYTIRPKTPLPTVTVPVVIDGTTQPGFAGAPVIELDGSEAGANANGLTVSAGDTTVKGLVINRFAGNGILLLTNGSNLIAGNYIGTNITGTTTLGNQGDGVLIFVASNNTIGGVDTAAYNIISGNGKNGIRIFDSNGNQIHGNHVGTDVTGTVALGNSRNGIQIIDAQQTSIGKMVSELGNIIAFNGGHGVRIESDSAANLIVANSVFSNTGLGISLEHDAVTPNDVGDGDLGANKLQNYPVLTLVSDGTNGIKGSLNSAPNAKFRVEFFSNASCNPSGHGEGKAFLRSIDVTTDDSGDVNFAVPVYDVAPGEPFVSATATDPDGNTSEFSQCLQISQGVEATPTPTTNSVATDTPTQTVTPSATPSETPSASISTPIPTSCPTGSVVTPGGCATITPTATGSLIATPTATATSTDRSTPPLTPTPTRTLRPIPTDTPSPTPTFTATPTATPTPSIVRWITHASGTWNDPVNWDPQRVPRPDDTVIIDVPEVITITLSAGSSIYALQSNEALVISSDLSIASTSEISNSLTMMGGNLSGSGTLTVKGMLTWSGGSMGGSGKTVAAGGLALSPGRFLARTLENAGQATFNGPGNFVITGQFNNLPGATFEVRGGGDWSNVSNGGYTSGAFSNAGTFRTGVGTNTLNLTVTFNNSGTVEIGAGKLHLLRAGASSGTFLVSRGAALEFGGLNTTYSLDATSAITGTGNVAFTSGSTVLGGQYNIGGVTTIDYAQVVFNGSNTATTRELQFTSQYGILEGTGDLTVSERLDWPGGTITGSGRLVNELYMTISGPNLKRLSGRILENKETVVWSGGDLELSHGAVINNDGLFDVQGDGNLRIYPGNRATINNTRLFQKSVGTGTTRIDAIFNNGGAVEVKTGTLALGGGGKASDGSVFTSTSAGTLSFAGGSFVLSDTVEVSGLNVVVDWANLDVGGNYNPLSTNVQSGYATFHPQPGSQLAALTVNWSTVVLNNTTPITATATLLDGQSSVQGTGDLVVTGLLTWNTGEISGSGEVVAYGGILMDSTYTKLLSGRRLRNMGTATWKAGPIVMQANAVIENWGLLDVQTDGSIDRSQWASLPLKFDNYGTFLKSTGTGTTTVQSMPFNNMGTVDVQTGTLLLAGGGIASGSFTGAPGATLELGAYTLDLNSKISIPNVRIFAAPVTIRGKYNVTGTTTINGGELRTAVPITSNNMDFLNGTLSGSGDITVTGIMTWTGGIQIGLGKTTVMNRLIMGGTSQGLDGGRVMENRGIATWNGSGFAMNSGAVFHNASGATFIAQNDGTISRSVNAFGIFENDGAFRKVGGVGTTAFRNVIFNSGGTVDVQTGTLLLAGGGTASGSFTGALGAILELGAYSLDVGSEVSIPNVRFIGAPVTIRGNYNVADTTTITYPVGNAAFLSGATVTSIGKQLTINGVLSTEVPITSNNMDFLNGTLSGTGDITVTGVMTWTGGIQTGPGKTTVMNRLIMGGTSQGLDGGRVMENRGAATWNGSVFDMNSGAVFHNASGATFIAQNDGTISRSVNAFGIFENDGTFRKVGGVGTTAFRNVIFNNGGTVDVQTGTLLLAGGGTASGSFTGTAGAILELGAYSLDVNSKVSIPNVRILGAPVTIRGNYNVADATTITYPVGNAAFLSGATVTSIGKQLTINGALSTEVPITVTNMDFLNGTLSGSGDITVTGVMTWTGGIQIGLGKTTVMNRLIMGGTSQVLGGRVMENRGAATWNGSVFDMNSGAVFHNASGATFIAQNDGTMSRSVNAFGTFKNDGTFRKVGGAGATEFKDVTFDNSGTVEVQTGTLRLGGGGTASGSFTGEAGTTLEFWGWFVPYTLDVGSSVNVPRVLIYRNILTLKTPITVTDLVVQESSLAGTGDIVATGVLTVTNVRMTGPGRTIANGRLAIAAGLKLDGREIVNNGAASWGNGAEINAFHGAIFRNTTNGTLDIPGSGSIIFCDSQLGPWGNFTCGSNIGPPPTFVNAGTVTHSGNGTFSLMGNHIYEGPGGGPVLFTNSGTVRVNAGEMRFEPYVQTAGATYLDGGSISSWGPLDIQGGTLSGSGIIGGSVTNAGMIEVGGAGAPATLTITSTLLAHYPPDPPVYLPGGNYNQTATGTLKVELGGATPGTQYDQLIANGSVTLNGTLDVSTIDGFTPASGAGFTVMTYDSHSGSFATVNGNGRSYSPNYETQALTLTAGPAVTVTATPTRNIPPTATPTPIVTPSVPPASILSWFRRGSF